MDVQNTRAFYQKWVMEKVLIFSRNWYEVGPQKLRFRLVQEPAYTFDVQHIPLEKLSTYRAYPPGVVFPVYLVSKIMQKKPSKEMLIYIALSMQLFCALLTSMAVWFFVLHFVATPYRLLCSLFAGASYLLFPASMYWHGMVYGVTVSSMPFIMLVLVLEFIKDSQLITKKWTENFVYALQSFFLLLGALTNLLFVLIALSIFIKRLLLCKKPAHRFFNFNALQLALPIVIYAGLFIWQQSTLGVLHLAKYFLLKLVLHSYFSIEGYHTTQTHPGWEAASTTGYGGAYAWLYFYIVGAMALFVALRVLPFMGKRLSFLDSTINVIRKDHLLYLLFSVSFLTICPFILHRIILYKWNNWHGFSTLHLLPFLTITAFIALPLLVQLFFAQKGKKREKVQQRGIKYTILPSLLIGTIILLTAFYNWEEAFAPDIRNKPHYMYTTDLHRYIKNNMSPEKPAMIFLYNPTLRNVRYPTTIPFFMAASEKQSYDVASLNDIATILRNRLLENHDFMIHVYFDRAYYHKSPCIKTVFDNTFKERLVTKEYVEYKVHSKVFYEWIGHQEDINRRLCIPQAR